MTIAGGAVYVLWRARRFYAVFAAAFFGQNGALAVY